MEISTPGRICLFGEHQDYLGLPIIALAISLRINLSGEKKSGKVIHINMPDIKEQKKIGLDDLEYRNSRDYFRSGIRICQNEGLRFSKGFDCKIKSQIPIKAGTISSSALVVSWINFLSRMADYPVKWDQKKIAEVAYKAEVEEFNESGGMMDQYATSIGRMIYLSSSPKVSVKKINYLQGSYHGYETQEYVTPKTMCDAARPSATLISTLSAVGHYCYCHKCHNNNTQTQTM